MAHTRRQSGSQLAEFAPALIILAFFVFIPALDLTIVPIRVMLAQELVNNYARKLAVCETFSQAFQKLEADPSLGTKLNKLGGVSVESIKLGLLITRLVQAGQSDQSLVVGRPKQVPPEWLPDGSKTPSSYALAVDVDLKIAPAILFQAIPYSIPGLTAPVPLRINASHQWGNLGRDPVTHKFYLNE